MTYYPLHGTSPSRRASIAVRSKYSLYKTELREDFIFKCGYCDTPDFYSGGRRGFHIDHFAPKSKFSALQNTYANLIYACPICNIGKSNDWPGTDAQVSFIGDVGFVDPCSPDYQKHLARDADGKIIALTPLGAYIHKKLRMSLRRRQICWLLERMEAQVLQLTKIIEQKGYVANQTEVKALCDMSREYFRYLGILKRD